MQAFGAVDPIRREQVPNAPRAPDVIYVLLDPTTQDVRYVGKTRNPQQRMSQHRQDAKRKDIALYRWWNQLLQDGMGVPIMAVIASVVGDTWEALERLLIAQYRADGADLLNVAKGGRLPSKTPEQMAEAGRRCAKAVHHGGPEAKRVWEIKKFFGQEFKRLEKLSRTDRIEQLRAKLRLAAIKAPETWGCYA